MKKIIFAMVATASIAFVETNVGISGKISSEGSHLGMDFISDELNRLGSYQWMSGLLISGDVIITSSDINYGVIVGGRVQLDSNNAIVLGRKEIWCDQVWVSASRLMNFELNEDGVYKFVPGEWEYSTTIYRGWVVKNYAAYQRKLLIEGNNWIEVSIEDYAYGSDSDVVVAMGLKKLFYSYE